MRLAQLLSAGKLYLPHFSPTFATIISLDLPISRVPYTPEGKLVLSEASYAPDAAEYAHMVTSASSP